MLRNTHLAAGIASSLMLTQPKDFKELTLAIGFGGIGSLISDIDLGESSQYKKINTVAFGILIGLFTILGLDKFANTGILNIIRNKIFISDLMIGSLLLIAVCIYGMQQPHRSFMHSLLALALISVALSFIYQPGIIYFGIGFLSHLFLDCFNKKKVQLLYPLGGGFSFGICYAKGLGNTIAFTIGCVVSIIEIGIFINH